MEWWEVQRFVNGYRRRERSVRESTRHIEWFLAKALGDKRYDSPDEMYSFPWEEEVVDPNKEDEETAELLRKVIEENKKNGFG